MHSHRSLLQAGFALLALGIAASTAACTTEATDAESESATQNIGSGQPLPMQLTARSLVHELQIRGVHTKAEALELLPRELRQRFVLVKKSASLSTATPDRPRVIHFLEDGRFTLASSGHGEDATANSLEIIEEDSSTHTFKAHSIFITPETGVVLTENDNRCTACHGSPVRPIWGSYPNWPEAYGEHEDKMNAAEKQQFDGFMSIQKTDPDYKHLEVLPVDTGFLLPTPYGFANVQFGSAIGDRYAVQLSERAEYSANYEKLKHAFVATSFDCDLPSSTNRLVDQMYNANKPAVDAKYPAKKTASKVWRLLGIDPANDLKMQQTVSTANKGNWEIGDQAPYQIGSDYLKSMVVFPAFAKIVHADAKMGELYASKLPLIESLEKLTVAGDLKGLQSLSRTSSPSYFDANVPGTFNLLHNPVQNQERKKSSVCQRLGELQEAAQR